MKRESGEEERVEWGRSLDDVGEAGERRACMRGNAGLQLGCGA